MFFLKVSSKKFREISKKKKITNNHRTIGESKINIVLSLRECYLEKKIFLLNRYLDIEIIMIYSIKTLFLEEKLYHEKNSQEVLN